MGFLDNSGDIILDAVLTDVGRKRLAAGNGTFRIDSFALGDEEINYALYQNSNHTLGAHPSGSAFYDLEIIQTPVLESFTNNTSTMKSTLMSIGGLNDFLYLPILKLNTSKADGAIMSSENLHVVAADQTTEGTTTPAGVTSTVGGGKGSVSGVLYGQNPDQSDKAIFLDQGIDNVNFVGDIGNFRETSFIIQIDSKFGTIVDLKGLAIESQTSTNGQATYNTQDDDNMMFYTVNQDTTSNEIFQTFNSDTVHVGTTGNRIGFKIASSAILRSNDAYFDKYGFTKNINGEDGTVNSCKCIDTIVRVSGITYGHSVDIPVRFVKHS
jgi:hypothetical protein